jgi:oligoendopeptidase F
MMYILWLMKWTCTPFILYKQISLVYSEYKIFVAEVASTVNESLL